MLLTLVRHGETGAPKHGLGDAGRFLSVQGREQARATGRALAQREVSPTRVFCSPLVRAVQTAELIVASLPFTGAVEARNDLYPDSSPHALFNALRELPEHGDLLVVGHMPYMPVAAGALLDLQVSGFSNAEAFRLEVRSFAPPRAALAWRWRGQFIG